ncbi:hypothetical protein WI93_28425 [Burkholderia vietnamiensis]|nr:hypothetical protein WI93_28425 [Burkholderia vietnamiensis]KVE90981.1 hypothetical protein WJ01_28035 [Burkholderia vietnamiensis]
MASAPDTTDRARERVAEIVWIAADYESVACDLVELAHGPASKPRRAPISTTSSDRCSRNLFARKMQMQPARTSAGS